MGDALFTVKPYVVALYGVLGVALLWSSASARVVTARLNVYKLGGVPGARLLLAGAGAVLTITYLAAGSALLLCALAVATAPILLGRDAGTRLGALLDGISVSAITLSLVWWRIEPTAAAPLPLAAFTLVLVLLSLGLRGKAGDAARSGWRLPTLLFLVAGLALVTDLGGYRADRLAITTLIHHWGAFIGPVQHLQAGLVPFYDVPLQYGLGPTAVLAATCRIGDCWRGAHAFFALADVAMALLVLAMALTTSRRRGRGWTGAVTTVVFAAAFFWPGFPIEGSALMIMPSAGGVRFLPVAVVACLWFFARPVGATLAAVVAVLWSPESAAMAIAVHGLCGTLHFGLRKAAASSAAVLFGSYVGLILLHRAVFGVWMDPAAFLEYVLHVPGPLPIDPASDILLLAAVLALGGWLVLTAPDAAIKRRDLASTALLFATSCYCFGRSHPNNICNLAPFLVLVGVRALDRAQGARSTIVAHGLAVFVAALAFSPWRLMPFDPHVDVGVGDLKAAFTGYEADIAGIRARLPRGAKLGIADFGSYRARGPSETIVWTPMDPSSLWRYVPSERRKLYIVRSAQRLGRSGWGIFADDQRALLDDLRAGYDVKIERRIDVAAEAGGASVAYTVACFDPKPAIVATRTGPACPDIDGLGPTSAAGKTAADVPPE